MRSPQLVLILSAIGLVLVLAGCSGDASAQAPVATSAISVRDNQFEPQTAEVAAGETVTWTWEGDSDHNVTGDGFQSDVQREGTFTQRFDEPGTYAYRCTLHGGMEGSVIVRGQGGGAGSEGP
jgi:plastocyanin